MCAMNHLYMPRKETSLEVKRWFQDATRGLWPIAMGSLSLRKSPCIRERCGLCESGVGHSSYALYGRKGKRRFSIYVPDELAPELERAIQNGLPDALDLIVVCIEAGSSLDQAIVRASDELEFALPDLAQELRLVTSEIKAGKARIEAFHALAKRTGVDDVRSLVAMLTQTDRFGTSIAQALRTHAVTSRTKRRQRAEERAAQVGVKLVFPLAFCFIPALYVVSLGPIVVRIVRTLL